jgi:hypothetical protein
MVTLGVVPLVPDLPVYESLEASTDPQMRGENLSAELQ